MNYGRRARDKKRAEKPFRRDLKDETLKEGSGKALEHLGVWLGPMVMVAGERVGIPSAITVAAGAATTLAFAIVGKGFASSAVNAMGRRRERKALDTAGRHDETATLSVPSDAGVGSIITGLGELITQCEQAEAKLAQVIPKMRRSQEMLTLTLASAHSEQPIRQCLISAREHVKDSADLIRAARLNMKAYLRSL